MTVFRILYSYCRRSLLQHVLLRNMVAPLVFAGLLCFNTAGAQSTPLSDAPEQSVSPLPTSELQTVINLGQVTSGSRVRGWLRQALPDSITSIGIIPNGYRLDDFYLRRDTLRWSPGTMQSSDSLVVLGELILSSDSTRLYPDTVVVSFSGPGPHERELRLDDHSFRYAFNYPYIDKNIYPSLQDGGGPFVLQAEMRDGYLIGSSGQFSLSHPDSSTTVMRFASARRETLVGRYWLRGPLEKLGDRAILANGQNVGIQYFYYGSTSEQILRAFGSAPEAIRFFGNRYGLVPDNRSVALTSLPGVMPASLVELNGIFGRPAAPSTPGVEASNVLKTASAVAFNYFGRYGSSSPSDSWLYTGLPLYLGATFLEEDLGIAAFDSVMLSLEDRYFAYAREYPRPLFTVQWHDPVDLIDEHAFARGAWTAHMIRKMIGDDNFAEVLVELQNSGNLQSDNLTQILEGYLAYELQPFQRELFYGTGHLNLQARWTYDPSSSSVAFSISHVDPSSDWPAVPVTIEVETLTGIERHSFILSETTFTETFSVTGRPRYITVDPDQELLAQIRVEQPVAAWVAQLRNSSRLGLRVKAARALAAFGTDPALLIGLKSALRDEQSIPVRIAILQTVARIPPGSAARQTLTEGLSDASPDVRIAALRGLRAYSDDPVAHSQVVSLIGSESDERVIAAAVDYLAGSTYEDRVGILQSALITETPKSLVRIAGINGMHLATDDGEKARIGRRYSSAGYPAEVRAAAIRLQASATSSARLGSFIKTYLNDGQARVRMEAASLLEPEVTDAEEILMEALSSEEDPLVRGYIRKELYRLKAS